VQGNDTLRLSVAGYRNGSGMLRRKARQERRVRTAPDAFQQRQSALPSGMPPSGWEGVSGRVSACLSLSLQGGHRVYGSAVEAGERFRARILVLKARHTWVQALRHWDPVSRQSQATRRGRWDKHAPTRDPQRPWQVHARHAQVRARKCVIILGAAACGRGSSLSRALTLPVKGWTAFVRAYCCANTAVLVHDEFRTSRVCPRCLTCRPEHSGFAGAVDRAHRHRVQQCGSDTCVCAAAQPGGEPRPFVFNRDVGAASNILRLGMSILCSGRGDRTALRRAGFRDTQLENDEAPCVP
jgi:hypothetical protein